MHTPTCQNPSRAPAREASFGPGLVYALGALMADQEGWVVQAQIPSLDAAAGWKARARGHGQSGGTVAFPTKRHSRPTCGED